MPLQKPEKSDTSLGAYLRACRARMDPAAFGFSGPRRRTPGLRREEVAQRANISPTWYTWLEQGRGGAPSADVLDRLAKGLMLTEAERNHLFMLGLGHMPEVRYRAGANVTPRLQRILDALEVSPALIKTPTWDVVAWNPAAALVLKDYGELPPEDRNILRLVFTHPGIREVQSDWEGLARFVVAAFRADVARAGAASEVEHLVEELSTRSDDFRRLWQDNEVRVQGEGTKTIHHPLLGTLELEFSSFSVQGRPDLDMIVYHPVKQEDADRIRTALCERAALDR